MLGFAYFQHDMVVSFQILGLRESKVRISGSKLSSQ